MAYAGSSEQAPRGPERAFRLIFSYKGTRAQLASQQAVEMTLPPSHPMHDYGKQSGFWFELRDAAERVLYRRVIHDPFRTEMEAPSGDPSRPFTRMPVKDPQGTFVILVPALDPAQSVVLCAGPSDPRARAAKEIVRVSLRPDGDKGITRGRTRKKGKK
jgi:hypothetical protein